MKEEDDIQGSGVYAPEVIDFVRSANEYCSWLEQQHDSGLKFIQSSLPLLSRVYYQIVSVEPPEPVMESGNEKFVTEQNWSAVFQRVLQLLGKHNEYLRIAEEDEYDRSDLVTHNISEDLADIYQDLKDFTLQYRQGIEEIMNDAVWEVIDNFENYWGEKLLYALRALHGLYVAKTDPTAGDGSSDEMDTEEQGPTYDNSFFTRLQDSNEEDV
ncbi:MAG: DUF5063 domain-containing protein [Bacteroidales bacterium]|nr:DUF5063 domain-containing protein [Bacteroidales bacterium]